MSQKTNLYVDIAILVGFLVAYEPALTGVAVHEWLSLAFASAVILHLLLHWDWVVQVTLKFFRKLFPFLQIELRAQPGAADRLRPDHFERVADFPERAAKLSVCRSPATPPGASCTPAPPISACCCSDYTWPCIGNGS